MIKIDNRYGSVEISPEYFAGLVGHVASNCYGVVGMVASDAVQGIKTMVYPKSRGEMIDKGVRVRIAGGELLLDLHIEVSYGVNIAAITRSIVNNVRYAVERATGFKVQKVNIFVDAMKHS